MNSKPKLKRTVGKLKVHTSNLLGNILADKNGNKSEVRIPLKQFALLLGQVADRCSEINDPVLNALMCRLTLYAIADPDSEDYDPQKEAEVLAAGKIKLS